MKKLTILAGAFLALSASTALASDLLENTYIGISGGASFAEDGDIKVDGLGTAKDILEYDTGFNFAANLGYRINDIIRVQADFGYLRNNLDELANVDAKSDLSGFYGTASIFGDYHFNDKVTAFAGVGAGVLAPRISDVSISGVAGKADAKVKDNAVALFKVGGGLSYSLNDNIDVIASYDYLRSAEFKVMLDTPASPNPGKMRLSTHVAQIGLRYNF